MIRCLFSIALLTSFSINVFSQEIPITILEEGHILTQVQVNDSTTANFILDTGAGAIVISSKLYEKIKETTEPAGHFTGFRHDGDRLNGELFTISSLSLRDYKVEGLKAGVYPPLDNYGIDGLLSLKFFENQAFSINYLENKLSILNKDQLARVEANSSPIEIGLIQHEDVLIDMLVPLCINDVLLKAVFDTGSGHSLYLVNPFFASRLGADTSMLENSMYTTPISGNTLTDYKFESTLSICGQETMEKSILFREGLIYESLVGSGLFKDGVITIDIPNSRMFFQK